MKKWTGVIVAVLCIFFSSAPALAAPAEEKGDTLYQVSTISALLNGVYDRVITTGELVRYGDLGIGTFEGLDGEMVVLDGIVYKVAGTGAVTTVRADEGVPFAVVTHFDTDRRLAVSAVPSLEKLYQLLQPRLGNRNMFYAVRIEGEFEYVKTRSVHKQQKPYPPLAAVTPSQAVFEKTGPVKGTLVGFWSPDFAQGLNVSGFHLHFLSDDRKFGGHLLDCRIKKAAVAIDDTHEFYMVLPVSSDFQNADLAKDWHDDIAKVEK